jgi:hypothetical protein
MDFMTIVFCADCKPLNVYVFFCEVFNIVKTREMKKSRHLKKNKDKKTECCGHSVSFYSWVRLQ